MVIFTISTIHTDCGSSLLLCAPMDLREVTVSLPGLHTEGRGVRVGIFPYSGLVRKLGSEPKDVAMRSKS